MAGIVVVGGEGVPGGTWMLATSVCFPDGIYLYGALFNCTANIFSRARCLPLALRLQNLHGFLSQHLHGFISLLLDKCPGWSALIRSPHSRIVMLWKTRWQLAFVVVLISSGPIVLFFPHACVLGVA
jgi:hypothetical protein